jgi:hypothetical protein
MKASQEGLGSVELLRSLENSCVAMESELGDEYNMHNLASGIEPSPAD